MIGQNSRSKVVGVCSFASPSHEWHVSRSYGGSYLAYCCRTSLRLALPLGKQATKKSPLTRHAGYRFSLLCYLSLYEYI
jgi:hypothetical protein